MKYSVNSGKAFAHGAQAQWRPWPDRHVVQLVGERGECSMKSAPRYAEPESRRPSSMVPGGYQNNFRPAKRNSCAARCRPATIL